MQQRLHRVRPLRPLLARGRMSALEQIFAAFGAPDAVFGAPGPARDPRLDEAVRMGIISKRAACDLPSEPS